MLIGLVALLLWVFIGATAPTVVKLSLREIPPITLTFLRFLIATIILFPIYWRQRPKKMTQSQIIKLVSIGSLGTAFNVGLYAYAIQFTSTITAQVLYAIVPIIVGILGFFLIKEKINQYQIAGTIVGFLGVLFLLYQSISSQDIYTLGTLFGNMIILIAVFTWSLYTVLSRDLSRTYSPVTISFASFISGTILLGILVPSEMIIRGFSLQKISNTGWFEILFLAVISSIVVYFLYQFGIKRTSAFIASLVFYLAPLVVALPSTIFINERVTPLLIIGAVLILFGVFLATSYEQARKYIRSVLQ